MDDEKGEYKLVLEVLEFAASPGESFSSKGVADPVKLVADALRERVDAHSDVFRAEDEETVDSQLINEAREKDSRLGYAILLRRVLRTIAMTATKNHVDSKDWTALSTDTVKQIMKVLELLIGMSLLPCLEDGIGVPLEKRVSYVKMWQRITLPAVVKSEIAKDLSVFHGITHVNEVLRMQLFSRYLGDYICANEQLIQLGCTDFCFVYEEGMKKFPRSLVMREMLQLNGGFGLSGQKAKTPDWFLARINKRLSHMLSNLKDGLFHLLIAFNDLGGESFWQNSVILTAVATLLATMPKSAESYEKYASKIFEQFLNVMKSPKLNADVSLLFGLTVDRLYVRAPFIIEVQLVDKLIRPWEFLFDRGILNPKDDVYGFWNFGLDGSLVVLRAWLNARKISATMEEFAFGERFAKLVPFFMHIAGQASMITGLEKFVESVSIILARLIGEKKVKESRFMLDQMLNDGNGAHGYFKIKKAELPKVDDVTNASRRKFEFPIAVEILEEAVNEEQFLDWKCASFKSILKHLPPSLALKTVTTLMADAVAIWTGSNAQFPKPDLSNASSRFVPALESLVGQSPKRLAVVYVLGDVVDFLGTLWSGEGNAMNECTSETLADMLDISKTIFRASTSNLSSYDGIDNVAVTPDSDELLSVEAKTLNLAVGLVSGVLTFGSNESELRQKLGEVATEMKSLQAAFATIKAPNIIEKYNSAMESANEFVTLLTDFVVPSNISKSGDVQPSILRKTKGFKRVQTKLEEWQELLEDEEVAARGYALIDIAKAVRARDQSIFKTDAAIDAIWNAAMAQTAHSDTYVFLASINVLAEFAYWRSDPCLNRLVDAFLSWSTGDAVSDEKLALAGKLGEAVAKVFRQLGDFSAVYFDAFINGILHMTKAGDELARASALSALADLMMAVRGRRTYLINELLNMITAYLKSDDSALVRRATIHLLRSMLTATGDDLLTSFATNIVEIHRLLKLLWLNDRDEVVRFHAESTLIDLNTTMHKLLGR